MPRGDGQTFVSLNRVAADVGESERVSNFEFSNFEFNSQVPDGRCMKRANTSESSPSPPLEERAGVRRPFPRIHWAFPEPALLR